MIARIAGWVIRMTSLLPGWMGSIKRTRVLHHRPPCPSIGMVRVGAVEPGLGGDRGLPERLHLSEPCKDAVRIDHPKVYHCFTKVFERGFSPLSLASTSHRPARHCPRSRPKPEPNPISGSR